MRNTPDTGEKNFQRLEAVQRAFSGTRLPESVSVGKLTEIAILAYEPGSVSALAASELQMLQPYRATIFALFDEMETAS